MSYTCRIYQIKPGTETELPPCGIQHRTMEAATACRIRAKGEAACHRWEIRGGDIVVARGAGPTGYERKGSREGVEWSFTRDYLTGQEKILITAYGEVVIEVEQSRRDRPRLDSDQVAGMAIMLRSILRTRETGWILELMECRPDGEAQQTGEAGDAQRSGGQLAKKPPAQMESPKQANLDDDLPPNVIIGPWRRH